jgi:hypothetical protein
VPHLTPDAAREKWGSFAPQIVADDLLESLQVAASMMLGEAKVLPMGGIAYAGAPLHRAGIA